MANPTGTYYTKVSAVAMTTAIPFFQFQAGAQRCEILEIRVWQTLETAIAMNSILLERGVTGGGGTALTEREWDAAGQAPTAAAVSGATAITGVSSIDLDYEMGWNILQELVWLPTPKFPGIIAASDRLDISFVTADVLTIGCGIVWEEYGA